MSDEAKLTRIRQLINKGKLPQARRLLVPLALTNDEARDMLERLDSIAPPTLKSARRFGILSTCASLIIGGGMVSLALVACAIIACVVLVAGAANAIRQNRAEQEAALNAENAGFGARENPVPVGVPARFPDFDITSVRVLRPATQMIDDMDQFNVWYEPPAAGTDYVLVWFRLDCKKSGAALCRGHNFSVKLVDSKGDEWGEPTILRVENNLDPQEAIGGNGIEGWQAFEFPQGGALAAIRLYTPLGPSLYTLPPGG